MTPNQAPLSPVRTAPATPLTLPAALSQAQRALDRIVLGKPLQIRLALACLLARGHLLLEDLPGVGKTTL
ncbi:AAA family ATPase, partial [Escherichia coli]|nr:AAA family ATPase [Escherichia coli]